MIFDRFRKKKTADSVTPEYIELVERLKSSTTIPSIGIEAREVDSLPLTTSKFFGEPYLPNGVDAPTAKDGSRLGFLAQIRLDELPRNDWLPEGGMLQFWIATDDVMGLDFEDMTDNRFAVIHYPTVDDTVTETSYVVPSEEDQEEVFSPYLGDGTYALTFTEREEPMSLQDYRFEQLFVSAYREVFPERGLTSTFELPEQQHEYLIEHLDGESHKLGGYPAFSQEDPRQEGSDLNTLLFQMISGNEIMWGDMGIANFFINSERLAAADFSRVGYTWDCS